MYEVRDNKRTLKFDGVLLAFSTSFRPGVKRWIEFALYKTDGGNYVLSRVGETHLFHDPECAGVSYPAFFSTLQELTRGA